MLNVTAAMLWANIVQFKCDRITQILPCLLTAAVETTKITQKHTPSMNYIKPPRNYNAF